MCAIAEVLYTMLVPSNVKDSWLRKKVIDCHKKVMAELMAPHQRWWHGKSIEENTNMGRCVTVNKWRESGLIRMVMCGAWFDERRHEEMRQIKLIMGKLLPFGVRELVCDYVAYNMLKDSDRDHRNTKRALMDVTCITMSGTNDHIYLSQYHVDVKGDHVMISEHIFPEQCWIDIFIVVGKLRRGTVKIRKDKSNLCRLSMPMPYKHRCWSLVHGLEIISGRPRNASITRECITLKKKKRNGPVVFTKVLVECCVVGDLSGRRRDVVFSLTYLIDPRNPQVLTYRVG